MKFVWQMRWQNFWQNLLGHWNEPDCEEEEAAAEADYFLPFHEKYADELSDDEIRTYKFMSENQTERQIVKEWAESWERKFDNLNIWSVFTHNHCRECGCMESQVRIRLEPTVDPPGPHMVSRTYHCLNSYWIKRVDERLLSIVRRTRCQIGLK